MYPKDSDSDGVPDWRDQLNGVHDNVPKTYLPNGSIWADLGNGIHASFKNGHQESFLNPTDGRYYSYFTVAPQEIGSGRNSVTGGLPPGIMFEQSGPEMVYGITPIDITPLETVVTSPY